MYCIYSWNLACIQIWFAYIPANNSLACSNVLGNPSRMNPWFWHGMECSFSLKNCIMYWSSILPLFCSLLSLICSKSSASSCAFPSSSSSPSVSWLALAALRSFNDKWWILFQLYAYEQIILLIIKPLETTHDILFLIRWQELLNYIVYVIHLDFKYSVRLTVTMGNISKCLKNFFWSTAIYKKYYQVNLVIYYCCFIFTFASRISSITSLILMWCSL